MARLGMAAAPYRSVQRHSGCGTNRSTNSVCKLLHAINDAHGFKFNSRCWPEAGSADTRDRRKVVPYSPASRIRLTSVRYCLFHPLPFTMRCSQSPARFVKGETGSTRCHTTKSDPCQAKILKSFLVPELSGTAT